MAKSEIFTAINYPGDGCEIITDATGFGFMSALFETAVTDFGNDQAASWPSYTEEDVRFTVRYDGQGTVVQEGTTWPVWILEFTGSGKDKILKVDIATCSSERWTDEGFVPGSFQDNSDLIAAAINLTKFSSDRLDEGNGPLAVYRRTLKGMM
ncbi:hypothetical protein H6800_03505 [Candidatus Nomurabacteria bacterium]|nr:hypothetical protein [Candidatus Nomurabacteria bacterium]